MGTGRRNKYKKTQLGGEVYAIGPLVFRHSVPLFGGVSRETFYHGTHTPRRLAFVLQDYPLT